MAMCVNCTRYENKGSLGVSYCNGWRAALGNSESNPSGTAEFSNYWNMGKTATENCPHGRSSYD